MQTSWSEHMQSTCGCWKWRNLFVCKSRRTKQTLCLDVWMFGCFLMSKTKANKPPTGKMTPGSHLLKHGHDPSPKELGFSVLFLLLKALLDRFAGFSWCCLRQSGPSTAKRPMTRCKISCTYSSQVPGADGSNHNDIRAKRTANKCIWATSRHGLANKYFFCCLSLTSFWTPKREGKMCENQSGRSTVGQWNSTDSIFLRYFDILLEVGKKNRMDI